MKPPLWHASRRPVPAPGTSDKDPATRASCSRPAALRPPAGTRSFPPAPSSIPRRAAPRRSEKWSSFCRWSPLRPSASASHPDCQKPDSHKNSAPPAPALACHVPLRSSAREIPPAPEAHSPLRPHPFPWPGWQTRVHRSAPLETQKTEIPAATRRESYSNPATGAFPKSPGAARPAGALRPGGSRSIVMGPR